MLHIELDFSNTNNTDGKNQILPICSIGMLWSLTNGKCFMG